MVTLKYIKIPRCFTEVVVYTFILFSSIFIIYYILDSKTCHNKEPCDPGWIGIGRKCYYYSYDLANWTESLDNCIALGADLVMYPLDSEAEYSITQHSCFDKYWVGAYRVKSSPYLYYIELEEKNRPTKNNECYYIRKGLDADDGKNVFSCNVTIHWICEKNMNRC
ncbi:C-type lectin-like protein [Fowlpox virus]|nr:C-type lectin-like protein [Fowlpox virus]